MKRLFILAALSVLALAKPELYKEQEDFQYSRSSTDEGSKSGFYGAQRGNMGGNYERAHNMDSLAQNQMSGLVRQVEGELGDGANTRAGQVYSSANSKGIYGSGHFDLSNLAGRNFHEGTYYDNSQSHSSQSQTSSAQSSANYASRNSHSHSNSRYREHQTSDAQTQTDDLQSLDNSQGSNQYYNYGRHSSGFQSQAGFQEHGEYDNNNANSNSRYGSNIRTRIISATPVRVVLTPGGRVAIPVAAQTYDANHASSALEQNAQNINSGDNQGYIPSNAKHYESSYKYHKKWEKHNTIPSGFYIVPVTEDPIPKNSELLEDREARLLHNYDTRGLDSQSDHSSSASGSYSGVKSSSSQSRYQSNYNTQYHGDSSSSNANLNNQFRYHAGANQGDSLQSSLNSHSDYTGSNSDLNSQVENLNTKPKSYQSSYSYHKSWERQGDPYVIKPASSVHYDSQASQRLTNQGYATHQSGSHYSQNQADCDDNGHLRIARSSYTDNKDMQQQNQNVDDLSQQSQTEFDQQNLGQESQNKWENLEDLNQQAQKNWGQQSLNLEQSNVEQQSQNTWNNFENLNQQSQTNWEQQNGGQQIQNQWDNLEELGQQQQTNLEQQDVGQQTQNQWDTFENLGNQSNKNWGQQSLDQNTFDDITQRQQTSDNNSASLRKYLQNFPGEHSQDNEQQQTHQPHFNNTGTSIDAPLKELDDKVPHKVETPWDKFDINDANKENKPATEQNIEISDFYWHHIPNNGMEDQQINKLNANGDIISDLGHRNMNTSPILEQANEYVGIDNNYNPNVPYSYSNGFVNPTIYNKRNFNPEYEHSQQVNSSNIKRLTETHINEEPQVTFQEPTTVSNSFPQGSKISSLWDKFDTIERESHFSTSDLKYVPKQGENNYSSSDAYQSAETTSARTYPSQTDATLNISSANQITPKQESQTVLPTAHKHSMSDTELPEEIENSNNKEPETPQDLGRGDIGVDESFIPSDDPKSHDMPDKVFTRDNTTEAVNNYHNPGNKSDNTKLNVLSLEPQKETNNYNKTNILVEGDVGGLSNPNKSRNISADKTVTVKSNTFDRDFGEVTQQVHNELQNQDTKLINMETSEQDRENLQNFQNSQQQSVDLFQQNVNKEHNLNNFEFQNVQDFIHHETNFDLEHSHNIEQEYRQDFAQQNHDLEQQNLHYFEQQNVQDFGQQNENIEQNLQNFAQESVQDFAQENKDLEQQSLYNFNQNNLREPRHDADSTEKQLLQNFDQQNVETHQFEQNVQDFNEENVNQHSLQQENAHNFWTENEQLTQQHLQDFGQINIPDITLQKQHDEQHHYRNIDNQNEDSFSDKLHQLENPKKETQPEIIPEQITEKSVEHKQFSNLEHLQPSVASEEKNVETPKEAVTDKTPIEAITEKPGFWKSLGNKLSNAKNKVVTWFKS